ncbi:MAG: carboxylating nicotinate-nucleotide diphosphorylase [Deltaproteobacteria bacterium]|nr:carboxylating nicotinate-nucleotide diphosphorylase [Deltaproteobacteria bacterium]
MNPLQVENIVRKALEEDLGRGDVTTAALIPEHKIGEGVLTSRSEGVLAGIEVADIAFRLLDPDARMERLVKDGDRLAPNRVIARVRCKLRALLSAERVALNFLQRLSGIATATAEVVEIVKPYGVRVLDTRKTTPGLRVMEKYAIRMGGGWNHRLGLDDAVLIKDNHLRIVGSIRRAVASARACVGPLVKVEVEVETLDQVQEAVDAGADMILLDNMPLETMRRAVNLVGGGMLIEASGNIHPDNAAVVAATGVDFISLGWLTHSAKSVDIGLDMAD